MTKNITVARMASEVHMGDWHDKPLRWIVKGPNDQHQMFPTKKDASKFASLYRKSDSMVQAINTFARLP